MKRLKEHIKSNKFATCYLFYGDEPFLMQKYLSRMADAITSPDTRELNYDVFADKSCDIDKITDLAYTVPFLAETRLIVVKYSELFHSGKKNDAERLSALLPGIPESTCIIFYEENVDKRGKLYKAVNKMGCAVEFKTPADKELTEWIIKACHKSGIQMSRALAAYMLGYCGNSMEALDGEIAKLTGYKSVLPDDNVITKEDINDVCTKSFESNIFDMVDAIGNKNTDLAVYIYNSLLMMKESPIMILTMVSRQFKLMLQAKTLHGQNVLPPDIAGRLGIRSFLVGRYLKQAANFSAERLQEAVISSLDTDLDIKRGRLPADLAVEMLIINYSAGA